MAERARVEKYGDGWTIWVEPGPVRMVAMDCCGFSFDAEHTDEPDGGYTCPCCVPEGQEDGEGLRKTLERWAKQEIEDRIAEAKAATDPETTEYQYGYAQALEALVAKLAALSTPSEVGEAE